MLGRGVAAVSRCEATPAVVRSQLPQLKNLRREPNGFCMLPPRWQLLYQVRIARGPPPVHFVFSDGLAATLVRGDRPPQQAHCVPSVPGEFKRESHLRDIARVAFWRAAMRVIVWRRR